MSIYFFVTGLIFIISALENGVYFIIRAFNQLSCDEFFFTAQSWLSSKIEQKTKKFISHTVQLHFYKYINQFKTNILFCSDLSALEVVFLPVLRLLCEPFDTEQTLKLIKQYY